MRILNKEDIINDFKALQIQSLERDLDEFIGSEIKKGLLSECREKSRYASGLAKDNIRMELHNFIFQVDKRNDYKTLLGDLYSKAYFLDDVILYLMAWVTKIITKQSDETVVMVNTREVK